MNDSLEIAVSGPLSASIRPPGSKSITNRALVCAALAEGTSVLRGALDSDDTRVMIAALQKLGLIISLSDGGETLMVVGCGGRFPTREAEMFVGNSGTTIRFLTALVALGQGRFRLDGVERMRQRPIGDLLATLNELGANARSGSNNDCPPVVVEARGLRGGKASIRGDISSQFLSGLLMAAPYSEQGVDLVVEGPLVSQPYVTMTLGVMAAFGVDARTASLARFHIPPGRYVAREYAIEPDASAASYFWGAAAVAGGSVTVEGLSRAALQGDVAFCDCLASMGCGVAFEPGRITITGGTLTGIDIDMNAISDTVPTLAVVALFASGPTTIRGVAHIRHKETDRIGDLARELRRLGASVEEFVDGLKITPAPLHGAQIETYNDHRMAMSFSLAALRVPGVFIKNPSCAEKTYPRYFDDLARITQT